MLQDPELRCQHRFVSRGTRYSLLVHCAVHGGYSITFGDHNRFLAVGADDFKLEALSHDSAHRGTWIFDTAHCRICWPRSADSFRKSADFHCRAITMVLHKVMNSGAVNTQEKNSAAQTEAGSISTLNTGTCNLLLMQMSPFFPDTLHFAESGPRDTSVTIVDLMKRVVIEKPCLQDHC
jgi:hypothetical protein